MRLLTGFVLGVALCLGAFGVWGCFTQGGLRRFNDADGIYPLYSLLAGCAFILLGICMLLLIASRARRRPERFGFPVAPSKQSTGG